MAQITTDLTDAIQTTPSDPQLGTTCPMRLSALSPSPLPAPTK